MASCAKSDGVDIILSRSNFQFLSNSILFIFSSHAILTVSKFELLYSGGHNPSYMYRLIADYYSADDLVVQRRIASGNWAQIAFVYYILGKFPLLIEFAKGVQIFTIMEVCYVKHESRYLSVDLLPKKWEWSLYSC